MAVCHNKKYEREFVNLMVKLGLTCFRIAGSGAGKEAVCDCVLYADKSYLVEVKATKENVFYMRKGVREQLQLMLDVCEKSNLVPLLAVKFKHRGWNILEVKDFENICFDKKRDVDENSGEDFIIT